MNLPVAKAFAPGPRYANGTQTVGVPDVQRSAIAVENSRRRRGSLNEPAFDYGGLDQEVAQALLDLAYYGERHREPLTRYARQRANQFIYLRASDRSNRN